ncbi:MAG TPA: hypothetical protein VHT73_04890 [Thermodesulfobacteriota bacterium]|nr:hypothetical protein [Thermodesulfobacteriota bacterium]
MIEVFLIEDTNHYNKQQLDTMRREFARNFMLHENPELEATRKPAAPETRLYVKVLKGAFPTILLKALDEDLRDSLNKSFFDAFIEPDSAEIPSLIFQFSGESASFEFGVKSRDKETLQDALSGVIEKLLEVLTDEETPSQSNYIQTFKYEGGDWKEVIDLGKKLK